MAIINIKDCEDLNNCNWRLLKSDRETYKVPSIESKRNKGGGFQQRIKNIKTHGNLLIREGGGIDQEIGLTK